MVRHDKSIVCPKEAAGVSSRTPSVELTRIMDVIFFWSRVKIQGEGGLTFTSVAFILHL